ncbi:hypothetical protein F5148DRAFT_1273859 [Russula earlei]|uniref:Uncharacterized protein n=1 Tax=Russula earlei TaxID=71964 RepID=A0ACC0UKL5_9AGAM|nr:hypothetical protein F5148DRAFT_1273859 [Russula earlei]
MSLSRSALPPVYYAIFGIYEPALAVFGFFGAMLDPTKTHNMQAPWPPHVSPPQQLPLATTVTVVQLAHVCGLLGFVNFVFLRTARRYLFGQPALQEKIVGALLAPLLVGDVLHLALTLWALGDVRWNFSEWTVMLWLTVIPGLSLLIPRITWHLGIGRYMESRDGKGKGKGLGANIALSGRL